MSATHRRAPSTAYATKWAWELPVLGTAAPGSEESPKMSAIHTSAAVHEARRESVNDAFDPNFVLRR